MIPDEVLFSLVCKKSLGKSTYQGLAFREGRTYGVVEEDERFLWVRDEKGNAFSFRKANEAPFYCVSEYFDEPT